MTFSEQINILFEPLNEQVGSISVHGTMTDKMKELNRKRKGRDNISVGPDILKLYATSSVEMWLRAVHSFLMSAALTDVSPIWASITGYYASHYIMRAIAHLLGLFKLHNDGLIVTLKPSSNGFMCNFSKCKGIEKREHNFYWKRVKRHSEFATDTLFTENIESEKIGFPSDIGHRSWANYRDNIDKFHNFSPLTNEELEIRIKFISSMKITAYPIPDRTVKFLDTQSVQVIAYHRIIRYRRLLDETFGKKNRFWSVYRNPSWCPSFMKFQLQAPQLIGELESR
jgi:hypothetical protein